MLVALTGASGQVGSATAAALHRRGHRVRVLVRKSSRREHIAPFVSEWRRGEYTNSRAQAALVAGADAVIHIAVDWTALGRGPRQTLQRNLVPSLSLLERARGAGAGQFLFVSSATVYGEILADRALDERHPAWPASVYGAYKAAVEPWLKAYHREFGMNTSAWRPESIYGVHPDPRKSAWFDLINKVKQGKAVRVDGGGVVVNVLDVAEALALGIGDESIAGGFFNLADCYVAQRKVAEFAKELTGSKSRITERGPAHSPRPLRAGAALEFFAGHRRHDALRRGPAGVREYIATLLTTM